METFFQTSAKPPTYVEEINIGPSMTIKYYRSAQSYRCRRDPDHQKRRYWQGTQLSRHVYIEDEIPYRQKGIVL